MRSFIDYLSEMVDLALDHKLKPPFVALVSEENPSLTHIPNKTMWPALVISTRVGVVKVGIYKDSQFIEQSPFGYSPDFIKVVSGYDFFKGLTELNHD